MGGEQQKQEKCVEDWWLALFKVRKGWYQCGNRLLGFQDCREGSIMIQQTNKYKKQKIIMFIDNFIIFYT